MSKVSLETILKDTLWVAKMTYGRHVGTYDEVGDYFPMEECRDFDLCAKQPEHLEDFYDGYFNYVEEHGFTIVQDYYKEVYNRES